MPLPLAPRKALTHQKDVKANNELAIKGILCVLIGLAVVVSPYFITSPGMQTTVAQSAVVGWFALVIGLAFWAGRFGLGVFGLGVLGLYAPKRKAL